MKENQIIVTVCELPNESEPFAAAWGGLVAHVQERSDVVVLPEMPFSPWMAATNEFDPAVWADAVTLHDEWLPRLAELGQATVLSSRPIITDTGKRLNEGFAWQIEQGYQATHHKYYLPEEPDFWEATWYERGDKTFEVAETAHGTVGFLLCTEIWFTEHARAYGRQGAHLLVCSRATEATSTDKWVMGGRAAAVMSGAFCLSSNRGGVDARGHQWGGHGWIIEPDQGAVLGTTSAERPFLTLNIDLHAAEQAKQGYPRYVRE